MFQITPQLVASDIRKSVEFYTAHFGFVVTHMDPPEEPEFVALERDDSSIFLVSASSRDASCRDVLGNAPWGVGVRLYFEVDDAAVLYNQLKAAGVPLVQELAVNPDEQYTEFRVTDPDGYEIGVYS